jgi:hypothetical protein
MYRKLAGLHDRCFAVVFLPLNMQLSSQPQEARNPKPFEYVIAETPQGRYVSFVDAEGHWFRVATKKPIFNVRSWYPVYSGQARTETTDALN